MTFANPAALWYLTLLLPLTLLYLLKVRPHKAPTTVLFLWDQVLQQKKATTLFNRLRNLISLLLLLTAVTSVVLAMAQPSMKNREKQPKIVLIMDTSASMQAIENGSSRYELGLDAVNAFLDNLNEEQQVILATADSKVQIQVNATEDFRKITEALEKTSPSDKPLNAEALAELKRQTGEKTALYFISDGCFEPTTELDGINMIQVGSKQHNIGIVASDMIRNPVEPHKIELFYQLFSTGDKEEEIFLQLCHENTNEVARMIPVTVKPGLNTAETASFEDERNGKWLVKIDKGDCFASDDIGYAVLPKPKLVNIGLKAPEDAPFYKVCLYALGRSDSNFKITDSAPDLVISHGEVLKDAPRQIVFAPNGKSELWQLLEGTEDDPIEIKFTGKTPEVLRFNKLNELNLKGIRKLKVGDGCAVLASTNEGTPLIFRYSDPSRRVYITNFDPDASGFFLDIQFPIMLYAMAKDLTGQSVSPNYNLISGSLHNDSKGKLTYDSSTEQKDKPVIKENELGKCGFYTLQKEQGTETYAVSLNNRFESNLNASTASSVKTQESPFPMKRFLLIIAIIIFAGESMLYHRRKAD